MSIFLYLKKCLNKTWRRHTDEIMFNIVKYYVFLFSDMLKNMEIILFNSNNNNNSSKLLIMFASIEKQLRELILNCQMWENSARSVWRAMIAHILKGYNRKE